MTAHEMRLHPEPFEMIKNGTKSVEIRLNDEKRQLMKVGDVVTFQSRVNPEEKVQKEIIGLDIFPTFENAFAAYPPELYGGKSKDEWKRMHEYYSPEEEASCSVVGIRLG